MHLPLRGLRFPWFLLSFPRGPCPRASLSAHHGPLLSFMPRLPLPHSSKPPWPHWGAWNPPWNPISYQSPPAAPVQQEPSPSGLQWREWSPVEGTQASPTAESLMGTPSLEEDSGGTAVVRASPVALHPQGHQHPPWAETGGTQPSWAAAGPALPPTQPGLPSAAGPTVGQPRHQLDTRGSGCTLSPCTQLPAVTITLPC